MCFFSFFPFKLLFVCLSVSFCVMRLTLYDMLVAFCFVFTVCWEMWTSRINTFNISITGVRHVDSWGVFGTVVKIKCARLSQKKIIHNMRFRNLVFATESSELCTSHEIIMRIICKGNVFMRDVS